MDDVIPALAVVAIAALIVAWSLRSLSRIEARLAAIAFAAHVFAAMAQVWITRGVYGQGDMLGFWMSGVWLGDLLRQDPLAFGPELVRVFFQLDHALPFDVPGQGASTGSLRAVAALLAVLGDDSLYAMALIVASAAFLGKLAMYRGLRAGFPESAHKRLLLATLLIPSVVFWSAGILKESVAIAGLGLAVWALDAWARGRWAAAVTALLLGGTVAAMVKPYIALAFLLAAGVWFYWRARQRRLGQAAVIIRPLYLGMAVAIAVGGVVVIGELFPRFAFDTIGQEAARMQAVGSLVDGGSNYSFGDSTRRTLAGQLAFAPLALLTSFFRPFIFEANNAQAAVAAAETSILLFLVVRTLARHRWSEIWAMLQASPTLMFCLTFAVVLGVGVGLGTTNMGSLSRYRAPLLPFLAVVVAIVSARPRVVTPRTPVVAPAPRRPERASA